ncbi:uncharacterized protein Z520_04565 [Fonsecaea multimorphosa CBS 102226]|uniref:Uncharacterized protein n=1 Tax=Fonsecaea multimorphosa CBS 102226 TaxID=1442371 RepID=A0A0D2KT87_9EURO|nr:uncharacterized protein Z520_04565 [Fonsecaea multimorphosa CBS 102226]KIX99928.1 hypothetical protein Z520_04565 [Fonsecaea multimorphosa CBS 102226]
MARISLTSVICGLLLLGYSVADGDPAFNIVGGGASLRRRQYGAMGHGAYGMFDGAEYRWHQIYDGTWVGVEPSEWDDAIHVQNNAPPPWSGYTTEAITTNSTLAERDLIANICNAGNTCLAATQNTVYNIATAATQFFTNLAQTQTGEAVLNLLSKPLVQKVAIDGAVNGGVSGLVGALVQKALGNNGPPTLTAGVSETSVCSTEKDPLDAVVLLLQQQATQFAQMNSALNSIAQELNAIKMSIGSATNSQDFITVTVATIECGQTPNTNLIGNCDIALNTC